MQEHELKGHRLLAVERFQDSTRWMIEFRVLNCPNPYGDVGDEMRLFLSEDDFRIALNMQAQHTILIRAMAHVIEGHIIYVPRKSRPRR